MSGDPFWYGIQAAQLDLPEPVVAFHAGFGKKVYAGECEITRGRHLLVRLANRLAGFPPEGCDVPVEIVLDIDAESARWTRNFGGHITESRLQWAAARRIVLETFGPFGVHMSLAASDRGLLVRIERMSLWALPLPRFIRPVSETREFVDENGRFCFDVSARLPGLGPVIRYRGWLRPVD